MGDATAVKATLTPDVAGDYTVRLTVSDGQDSSPSVQWTVSAARTNAPPVASAGGNQAVQLGSSVVLDGSRSADPEGALLTYEWVITDRPLGSRAALLDASTVRPRFTPDVSGQYVVALTVRDGQLTSAPATVSVTVGAANVNPVAVAGARQSVLAGALVTLDGSASSDANGDLLTYIWTLVSKPPGSVAALSSSAVARPTFVPDAAGDYVASLVVNDGTVSSTPSFVTINAGLGNVAPVASAGPNRSITTGTTVSLDGSASSDANGDLLSYRWVFVTRPNGSVASIVGDTTARPSFTADASGDFVVGLTVSDGKLTSPLSTVTVTASVANSVPVASAGTNRSVVTGAVVVLDGTGSSDANNDPLTFTWTLVSKPIGSTAALVKSNTAQPNFTADLSGTYVATLTVSDRLSTSLPSVIVVTAAATNAVPVAVAGSDRTSTIGQPVTLNGSASFDPNGDPITFGWTLVSRPATSTALLSGGVGSTSTNVSVVSLTPDVAGTYVASLIVSDGRLSSTASVVTIVAKTNNRPPVANAGAATSVAKNVALTLSGSLSSDPDADPMTYAWTVLSRPTGATESLIGATSVTPVFTADTAGQYIVQLVVSDGVATSVPALLIITVTP